MELCSISSSTPPILQISCSKFKLGACISLPILNKPKLCTSSLTKNNKINKKQCFGSTPTFTFTFTFTKKKTKKKTISVRCGGGGGVAPPAADYALEPLPADIHVTESPEPNSRVSPLLSPLYHLIFFSTVFFFKSHCIFIINISKCYRVLIWVTICPCNLLNITKHIIASHILGLYIHLSKDNY